MSLHEAVWAAAYSHVFAEEIDRRRASLAEGGNDARIVRADAHRKAIEVAEMAVGALRRSGEIEEPHLRTDIDLAEVIETEMKFVEDDVQLTFAAAQDAADRQLGLIQQFVDYYENTNQDTVLFAPEAYVVIRNILQGKRPVKLRYLTEFEGEEK
jgi:hypothetical protein